MNIGFIGLGRMGYHIAKNINKYFKTYVWNRTQYIAKRHSEEHNTEYVPNINQLADKSDIILLCLPTYKEVDIVVNSMYNKLKDDKIIIDCTSSVPIFQQRMYKKLKKKNVHFFDCPISGGQEKASLGTLTAMIGGDKDKYNNIKDIVQSFAKPKYVGKIGNGCAIKSINNILNVSHLCLAAECLSSLHKIGIDYDTALDVINESSGRSLMTQERIPKHIFSKNYNYGFSLGLMAKDVDIALKIIDNPIMFSQISSLLEKGLNKYGHDADYTEIAKLYFDNIKED